MVWLVGGDEIQRGSRQLQLGESRFQGGERLEDSWVRGRGESREDKGGGETGRVCSSLQTLHIGQLTSRFEKPGEKTEYLQVVTNGRQSNTARVDLIKVSSLVVCQAKSLNVLHAHFLTRTFVNCYITVTIHCHSSDNVSYLYVLNG